MEFLQRAKVFRLKCSHQSKYLTADQDEETLKLSRESSSPYARWSYELVEGKANVIRLKSCQTWKYLAASEERFLLGMTGRRLAQRPYLVSTVEWEPIKEGPYVKLKSHCGTFLRGDKGPPPYRNTITHDVPGHWTVSESMTLWIVDIIEIDRKSTHGGVSKTNEAASLSSNVADQNFFSSKTSLSNDDDGSTKTLSSSLEHFDSFIKLKSMLSALDDELTVKKPSNPETIRIVPEYSVLEVKKAKQTFEQLKDKDFRTILSLGRAEELEKAVNVLISDAKYTGYGKVPAKLTGIKEQLKAMKNDHNLASQDLVEYSTFSTRKLETRTELKKHASMAKELEKFEVDITNTIMDAKAKRAEILKQLEETENTIKNVEKSQRDNMAEIEELVSTIGKKSEELMDMESKVKSWRIRKNEAERMLERIEEDWNKAKRNFQNV